eukprot:982140-Amphidinium_carterae.1
MVHRLVLSTGRGWLEVCARSRNQLLHALFGNTVFQRNGFVDFGDSIKSEGCRLEVNRPLLLQAGGSRSVDALSSYRPVSSKPFSGGMG